MIIKNNLENQLMAYGIPILERKNPTLHKIVYNMEQISNVASSNVFGCVAPYIWALKEVKTDDNETKENIKTYLLELKKFEANFWENKLKFEKIEKEIRKKFRHQLYNQKVSEEELFEEYENSIKECCDESKQDYEKKMALEYPEGKYCQDQINLIKEMKMFLKQFEEITTKYKLYFDVHYCRGDVNFHNLFHSMHKKISSIIDCAQNCSSASYPYKYDFKNKGE